MTTATLCATICCAGTVFVLMTEGPGVSAALLSFNFMVWAITAWIEGDG